MKGTIKILNNRNYGFIRGSNGGEYFFHRDDFAGHWIDLLADWTSQKEPIEVTFEIVESPKGPRAAEVKRADYPNQST